MTVGAFEPVSFPGFETGNVFAKVDTGAYSGAMHCTSIKVVRRGHEKRRVLKFNPFGKEELAVETEAFRETYVRSATGHRVKRFMIDTEITIRNKTYPITIGLSDRSDLRWNVLLGRKFLRNYNIIVDVSRNEALEDEREDNIV